MTRLDLDPLTLGSGDLGNLYSEMSDELAWSILDAAWDGGIRSFDTAPHYGLGLAERRLGAFLQTKPRDSYVLSTKAGRLLRPNPGSENLQDDEGFAVPAVTRRVWDCTPTGVRASLEESLTRLGLDRVDILYLHGPQTYVVPSGARYEHAPAPADVLARARRLAAVCAEHGVPLPTAALHLSLIHI